MNEYFIEHGVKTLAQLFDSFDFDGFKFEQWDSSFSEGPKGTAWRVSRIVQANNINDAFQKFSSELFPIVNRIGFVSQCFTMIELQPFFVIKMNQNEERILFVRYTKERVGTPLVFGQEEQTALAALENYHEKGDVFRLLRESTNASFFYTRLAMLVAALEAMAGERTNTPAKFKMTDKDYIRTQILKDDGLYNAVFGYGTGIRNVILHGMKLAPEDGENKDRNYIGELYKAILGYFRETHGVEINTCVVSPQRTPTENYDLWSGWLKPKTTDITPTLPSIQTELEGHFRDSRVPEKYEFMNGQPLAY